MEAAISFKPTLWFVCKLCRLSCPSIERLIAHKVESHLEVCREIQHIVFEETFLTEFTPPPKDASHLPMTFSERLVLTPQNKTGNNNNNGCPIPSVEENAGCSGTQSQLTQSQHRKSPFKVNNCWNKKNTTNKRKSESSFLWSRSTTCWQSSNGSSFIRSKLKRIDVPAATSTAITTTSDAAVGESKGDPNSQISSIFTPRSSSTPNSSEMEFGDAGGGGTTSMRSWANSASAMEVSHEFETRSHTNEFITGANTTTDLLNASPSLSGSLHRSRCRRPTTMMQICPSPASTNQVNHIKNSPRAISYFLHLNI